MSVADTTAGRRSADTDIGVSAEVRSSTGEGDASAWAALTADDPAVFARGWLAITARSFPAVVQGMLFVARPGVAEMEALSVWSVPGRPFDLDRMKSGGSEALATAGERRTPALADFDGATFAAQPVVIDGAVAAMALLEARLDGPVAGRRLTRHLQWSAAWIEALLRRNAGRADDRGIEAAALVVEAIETVSTGETFADGVRALAGLVAGRFACGRVALGVRKDLSSRVVAFSQSADFESRSEVSRAFEAAMDEAIDQETALAAPAEIGGGGLVAHAQIALHRALHVDCVLTLPIFTRDGAFGAMVLARSGAPFTQADVDLLDALVTAVGATLAARRDAEAGLRDFVGRRARRLLADLLGPRLLMAKVAGVTGLALLATMALVTDVHRVTAPGQINGEARRVVGAPFDGYLQAQFARAGDVLRAGAALAELQDNDLVLTRLRHVAARRQTQLERDRALAKRDLAEVAIAQATIEQKDAEIALAEEMLERARIRAPFDAVVVSGDLSQSIGKPVARGEVLFELAPLDHYRVTIEVPETAIGSIRPGQTGKVLLTALPERGFAFEVVSVTPVSRVVDGVNSFEVLARLSDPDERIRPAMEGSAKIEVGHASLLWIWTHSFFDWLRIRVWSWWP